MAEDRQKILASSFSVTNKEVPTDPSHQDEVFDSEPDDLFREEQVRVDFQ